MSGFSRTCPLFKVDNSVWADFFNLAKCLGSFDKRLFVVIYIYKNESLFPLVTP